MSHRAARIATVVVLAALLGPGTGDPAAAPPALGSPSPVPASLPAKAAPGPSKCEAATAAFEERPPSVPAGLPWSVVLETTCGRYAVRPDGAVRVLPSAKAPSGRGQWFIVPVAGGGWANIRRGHVVVVRDGRVRWRSAAASFLPRDLGAVALGSSAVAFSIYRSSGTSDLFMAPISGAERRVAEDQEPLAWLGSGNFLVSRWREDGSQPDLLLRSPAGELRRVVARRVPSWTFDRGTGSLLFMDRERLLRRTDGRSTTIVADLGSLGFRTRPPSNIPGLFLLPNGLISVQSGDLLALLHPDGRTWATATSPLPKGGWGWIGSPPATMRMDPDTGQVVFLVTKWNYTDGRQGWKGWEGIVSLGPAGTPRIMYGKALWMAPCAHIASMSWHGRWILYAAREGRTVAVDTSGRHDPVDLSALARKIPHLPSHRAYPIDSASWAV